MDTGPLVALTDRTDAHHTACRDWYADVNPRNLAVPAPVIAEACYLIALRCGAEVEATFLEDLAHGWYGTVTAIMPEELLRASELVRRYADFPLGGTDACVMAVAERLKTVRVCTVDRRHFATVRPLHAPAFELYPLKL
ncbi:PIN domain-containing protein [Streptomyces sp. B-S-A8]|uniref:Ribonuclease VapC n=1 Tax=Streptomyces solicavernae TaxID=3043614 RepID=A0ABT6RS42_9ACTN|nr:PIN domain-containing protein [Streptomyces sp. B-S-A8]MDI3387256.1 PIN domain-containing protein [Streptomyces sp. B-S-A8]